MAIASTTICGGNSALHIGKERAAHNLSLRGGPDPFDVASRATRRAPRTTARPGESVDWACDDAREFWAHLQDDNNGARR